MSWHFFITPNKFSGIFGRSDIYRETPRPVITLRPASLPAIPLDIGRPNKSKYACPGSAFLRRGFRKRFRKPACFFAKPACRMGKTRDPGTGPPSEKPVSRIVCPHGPSRTPKTGPLFNPCVQEPVPQTIGLLFRAISCVHSPT